jgi:hypothetical protein
MRSARRGLAGAASTRPCGGRSAGCGSGRRTVDIWVGVDQDQVLHGRPPNSRRFFHPVCRNQSRSFYHLAKRARVTPSGEEDTVIAARPARTQEHSGVSRASGRTYDEWVRLARPVGRARPSVSGDRRLARGRAPPQRLVGTEAGRRVRASARAAPSRRTARRHLHRRHQHHGPGARRAPRRRRRGSCAARPLAARRRDARTHLAATSVGPLRLGGRRHRISVTFEAKGMPRATLRSSISDCPTPRGRKRPRRSGVNA